MLLTIYVPIDGIIDITVASPKFPHVVFFYSTRIILYIVIHPESPSMHSLVFLFVAVVARRPCLHACAMLLFT